MSSELFNVVRQVTDQVVHQSRGTTAYPVVDMLAEGVRQVFPNSGVLLEHHFIHVLLNAWFNIVHDVLGQHFRVNFLKISCTLPILAMVASTLFCAIFGL